MAKTQLTRAVKRAVRIRHLMEASSLPLSVDEAVALEQARRAVPSAIGRRGFLGFLGAISLGSCLQPTEQLLRHNGRTGSHPQPPARGSQTAFDTGDGVVIVGGGLAGLSAAHTLMNAGVRTTVLEASPRFGGRVETLRRFNSEGMFCELGGELVDSDHDALRALCKALGIELEALDPVRADAGNGIFFFGGAVYGQKDLTEKIGPFVAALSRDLRSSPKGAARGDFDPRFDLMTAKEYLLAVRELDPWVTRLLDVSFQSEFGRATDEQSALNILSLFDAADLSTGGPLTGTSDEAWRIRGGSETLVTALVHALASRVALETGSAVEALQDKGTHFELVVRVAGQSTPRVVKAGQVILAVPFTALRRVDGLDGLGLTPQKVVAVREFGYGTNAKVMLGFRNRFWRGPSTAGARTYSGDLLTDLPTLEYWETSRRQAGLSGILTNYLSGEAGCSLADNHLEKCLSDLGRVRPEARGAFDGLSVSRCWATHEHVWGSYSCPRPGQFLSVSPHNGEPELANRLLFAGEHTSLKSQGFMDGAVESGQVAARAVLQARSSG